MPSKSKAQHNLMAMVAHDPKAAKRVGIPQSVGKDYVEADKGRKFGSGGMKGKINKRDTRHGKLDLPVANLDKYAGMAGGGKVKGKGYAAMEKKHAAWMEKHGAPKSMVKEERKEGAEEKGEKYARGGGIESRGKTKGKMIKMAGGGSVGSASKRADGIAVKGKTRGKMC